MQQFRTVEIEVQTSDRPLGRRTRKHRSKLIAIDPSVLTNLTKRDAPPEVKMNQSAANLFEATQCSSF